MSLAACADGSDDEKAAVPPSIHPGPTLSTPFALVLRVAMLGGGDDVQGETDDEEDVDYQVIDGGVHCASGTRRKAKWEDEIRRGEEMRGEEEGDCCGVIMSGRWLRSG
ncbi:hypothetical protein Tdes44962_MAKER08455 [Teratosphaeria destructans]|uniref:Uncharacterized protein n=1 Tax=Teratosphaeria destructans TaxID=418781 RepID=A0A9W7SWM4_9PEZI|nr:hypothetical protein Tdes44962_MAKER08455 [Teratosphaeria destructans]